RMLFLPGSGTSEAAGTQFQSCAGFLRPSTYILLFDTDNSRQVSSDDSVHRVFAWSARISLGGSAAWTPENRLHEATALDKILFVKVSSILTGLTMRRENSQYNFEKPVLLRLPLDGAFE